MTFEDKLFNLFTLDADPGTILLYSQRQRVVAAMVETMRAEIAAIVHERSNKELRPIDHLTDPLDAFAHRERPGGTNQYAPPPAWRCVSAVERARHLFQCFYGFAARRHSEQEGITENDIRLGALLAEQDKADRKLRRNVYGDPAYGAHPAYAVETKANCVQCGRRREITSLSLDPLCECELGRYQPRPKTPSANCECSDCQKALVTCIVEAPNPSVRSA